MRRRGQVQGAGTGGRHTDGVGDEHGGEVVDSGIIERHITVSTWISMGACMRGNRHLIPSRVRLKEYPMPHAEPVYPKTPE